MDLLDLVVDRDVRASSTRGSLCGSTVTVPSVLGALRLADLQSESSWEFSDSLWSYLFLTHLLTNHSLGSSFITNTKDVSPPLSQVLQVGLNALARSKDNLEGKCYLRPL